MKLIDIFVYVALWDSNNFVVKYPLILFLFY